MSDMPVPMPDRLLRFADLTIGGGAIPLPLGLIPSALPQEIVQAEPHDTATNDLRAPGDEPPPMADAAPPPVSAPLDDAIPDEAVLNSLNAAVDALRVSLVPTSGGRALDGPPVAMSDTDIPPLSLATALDPAVTVSVVAEAPAAEVNAPPDAAAAVAAQPAPPVSAAPIATPVDTLANAATPVVTAVEATVQGAVDVVDAVVDATLGNVLVPSLQGLGLDALAGLLPAAPQTPSSDSGSVSHDSPLLDVIGLPEVLHDQDWAQSAHAPQHLVGSGLV